jgi:tetratricopeptide (TPR) repeat protein
MPEINTVREEHYQRGLSYAKRRAFDDAIAEFTEALKITPNHDRSYYARGLIWENKGKLLQAIDDFDRALQINPNLRKARDHRREAMHRLGLASPSPSAPAPPTNVPPVQPSLFGRREIQAVAFGLGALLLIHRFFASIASPPPKFRLNHRPRPPRFSRSP